MIRAIASVLLLLAASACVTVDYPTLPAGAFRGSVVVIWVGEGDGTTGDGKFLFVPDPANRLTFTRAGSRGPGAVIQPGLMYTDGGSIPRIAQVFNGLSPWGYAPAYMVHDWIFTGHHCVVDGLDDGRFAQVRDVTFEDSAAILGEAIQALVEQKLVQRRDVAAGAITAAVGSGVARGLWDQRGACLEAQVTPADVAAAERLVPGSSQFSAGARFRVPDGTPRTTTRSPARVVTRVTL